MRTLRQVAVGVALFIGLVACGDERGGGEAAAFIVAGAVVGDATPGDGYVAVA